MKISKQLILIGILGWQVAGTNAGTIHINPGMGTAKITEVLNGAGPGDTLLFLPGNYPGPFVLNDLHGMTNNPIVIKGSGEGDETPSVIDNKSEPGMYLRNYAFLLQNCSWISIENFTIINCWTDLIRAEDAAYLSLKHCKLFGGKRALFATGRGSHHFLIEDCTWEQDERLWTHAGDYSWDEIHHGVHRHFNGSIFQGSKISGVFVLRDNLIKNTFNAFRLSQIDDGETDLLACTNGEIYRNTIINTSDNVLEPEKHTLNLHYYHNQMVNGHAFVSITEVTGGYVYIYGNTAVSLPDSEDGWTIFKISSKETALTKPLYIFNNSWHVDFDMIGSPRNIWKNNHVKHFNNAAFSENSDSFGIYNLGLDNHFDYDCSNVPFPSLLTDRGFEENGIVGDPLFRDPYNNDFRLQDNSPCVDRGTSAEGLIMDFHGAGPDIGAYDNGELIEGPPFRYLSPEAEVPFKEMPRITRVKFGKNSLRLWFSMPLTQASVLSTQFRLSNGKKVIDLKFEKLYCDAYCVMLSSETEINSGAGKLLLSKWPRGENGMQITSWASAIPLGLY